MEYRIQFSWVSSRVIDSWHIKGTYCLQLQRSRSSRFPLKWWESMTALCSVTSWKTRKFNFGTMGPSNIAKMEKLLGAAYL
jgi:hypothetical protein